MRAPLLLPLAAALCSCGPLSFDEFNWTAEGTGVLGGSYTLGLSVFSDGRIVWTCPDYTFEDNLPFGKLGDFEKADEAFSARSLHFGLRSKAECEPEERGPPHPVQETMKVSGEGFISSKATLGCYDDDRLWSARLLVDEFANKYFGGWTGLPPNERP